MFDRNVRYGPVGHSSDDSQPNFDPLAEYGLDADPPRPPATWGQTDRPGDDLLLLRSTEHLTNAFTRLAGRGHQFIAPLPPRLARLADWIVKIAHEPVALWWAAKYPALHPDLLEQIEWRIRQVNDETIRPARPVWRLLIEKFQMVPEDGIDSSWYETRERIGDGGLDQRCPPSIRAKQRPVSQGQIAFFLVLTVPGRQMLIGRRSISVVL